jgi:hypothetical protein
MTKACAEPSWKTETRTWTSPLVADPSDRGIPKALRIVANVLTPSGDLSTGIKRRQLFHFVGIDVEMNEAKLTTFLCGATSRLWHRGSNLYRRRRPRRRCSAGVQGFPQIIIALRHLT